LSPLQVKFALSSAIIAERSDEGSSDKRNLLARATICIHAAAHGDSKTTKTT
jgi:hypothetical protein